MPILISLEGNIGSGKSTLLERLITELEGSSLRIKVLKEPIEDWTKVKMGDKNILELFYEDPKQYAFDFQVLIYMSLYDAIKKQQATCDILICERSLESNINIFAKMLYDKKYISETQWGILQFMAQKYKIHTDLRFYLFCPFSICHYRVRQRARQGEEKLTLDYLKDLQDYHRNYFLKYEYNERIDNYESDEPQKKFIDWFKLNFGYTNNRNILR